MVTVKKHQGIDSELTQQSVSLVLLASGAIVRVGVILEVLREEARGLLYALFSSVLSPHHGAENPTVDVAF